MSTNDPVHKQLALLWTIEALIDANLAKSRYNLSLGSGMAGIALFYSGLLRLDDAPAIRSKLDGIVDLIHDNLSDALFLDSGLFMGIPGVGYALEQVAQQKGFAAEDIAGMNSDLDALILDDLSAPADPVSFDLVSGLAGLGVYALSRSDSNARDRIFKLVYKRLLECSTLDDQGRRWRTHPKFGVAEKLLAFPDGYYDLGLAHGNAGIVALFARAVSMGMDIPGLREELHGLTAWLLRQRRRNCDAAFGRVAGETLHARNAWCVGDAGVGTAILQSGLALGDAELIQAGTEIGMHSTRRDHESSNVQDHGLCHGSMGLSLIYNHLYDRTGEPAFFAAAGTWRDRMLDAVSVHALDGLATYRGPDMPPAMMMGAVNGLAGVGLALIDNIEEKRGNWSKFLCL